MNLSEAARSRLFLVRLWEETREGEPVQWRGRVLHVTTGKAHSFSNWVELVDLLSKVFVWPTADNSDDLHSSNSNVRRNNDG